MSNILSSTVHALVFLNGVYDFLCFLGIMWFKRLPFVSSAHLRVFRSEEDTVNPLTRRLLAYWILTYGTTRMLAGALEHDSYALDCAAAVSYLIEVFGFEYELCVERTVIRSKVTFITLASLPIATALLVMKPLERNTALHTNAALFIQQTK